MICVPQSDKELRICPVFFWKNMEQIIFRKNQEAKESSEAEQKFTESQNLINKATLVIAN